MKLFSDFITEMMSKRQLNNLSKHDILKMYVERGKKHRQVIATHSVSSINKNLAKINKRILTKDDKPFKVRSSLLAPLENDDVWALSDFGHLKKMNITTKVNT